MNDRLSIIYEDVNNVVLVGYRRANNGEVADLERGFPISGRWRMDYVDTFDRYPNGIEWAQSVANDMWGTVYSDNGVIYTDDLLTWTEVQGEDHYLWAVRNKDEYENKCIQSFGLDTAPR